jgi:hypothetical protein
MLALVRPAILAWSRWRWKRQAKSRVPRSLLADQEELQRARRQHKPTRHIIERTKQKRHQALRMEVGR